MTTPNRYLIEEGGLDIHNSPVGSKSVTYEMAIFREGEPNDAAIGQLAHVFVNRTEWSSAHEEFTKHKFFALMFADKMLLENDLRNGCRF